MPWVETPSLNPGLWYKLVSSECEPPSSKKKRTDWALGCQTGPLPHALGAGKRSRSTNIYGGSCELDVTQIAGALSRKRR